MVSILIVLEVKGIFLRLGMEMHFINTFLVDVQSRTGIGRSCAMLKTTVAL